MTSVVASKCWLGKVNFHLHLARLQKMKRTMIQCRSLLSSNTSKNTEEEHVPYADFSKHSVHDKNITNMARALLVVDTKEDRLSHAKEICTFSKDHPLSKALWHLEGMEEVYRMLSTDLSTSSTAETVDLMSFFTLAIPSCPNLQKTCVSEGWSWICRAVCI